MTRSPPRPPADILALEALSYLAHVDGALSRFADETGTALVDLPPRAGDPEFLAAVLDFVLAHEDLAEGFCTERALSPETLHRARMDLPGG